MTPQELKNSILKRAIEGKLVEQRKEEGTGEELLETIFEEVNSFVKLNSISKNNKHIKTENNEDDFEIPENWGKVKLGEICFLFNGRKETNKSYPYLEVKYLRGNIEPKIKTSGKVVSANTNIILMDGENSGEVFKTSETGYLGSTLKILYIPEILSEKFYLYFLLLNKNYLRDNKKGAAIPHLDKEVFFNLNFPIPPLAEQKRIVEKIEELMPLVDKYEKNWQKLEELNKKFPEDMKKSLLQEAIKGKLVEQRPEESTGEERYKLIQEEKNKLVEEEILFDIPEYWNWVKLGQICNIINGFTPRRTNPEFWNGEIPWFTIEDVREQGRFINYTNQHITEKALSYKSDRIIPRDTVLLCCTASVGEYAYTNIPLTTNQQFNGLVIKEHYKNFVSSMYLYIYSQTLKDRLISNSGKTTFNYLSVGKLKEFVIPIPPLAEQERIVEKLDEMLPYCDELLRII